MAKKPFSTKPITKLQASLSGISIVCGILYVVLLLLLHILEPEYDPTWRFISEYALGKYGFLMNACFLLYSISAICIGLSIILQIKTIIGYVGLFILAVSAVGIGLAGLYNTDPVTTEFAEITFSGKMHITGASLDYAPLAFLLLAFSLGRHTAWRLMRNKLFITAAISILLSGAFMASMPNDYKFGPGVYTGLIGRFLFASYLASILVIGFHVRKLHQYLINPRPPLTQRGIKEGRGGRV
jgi:hypothetical protein